jgi:signal transduction histidine kinase
MMLAWSLRGRMMLMFCAVVGVLLATCFVGLYVLLSRQVYSQLDQRLQDAARPVIADLVTDSLAERDVDQLEIPGEYFELFDPSGHVLQRSHNLQMGTLNLTPSAFRSHLTSFQTIDHPRDGRLRVAAIPFHFGKRSAVLTVAVSTREAYHILASFRAIIFLILPLSLLLTALVSAWYVGKSLTPIGTFTQHAERMAERASGLFQTNLWQPLPVKTPRDDLSRLAETFNQLFERVASAVGQSRQFVSDAAHELRTPLSVLRGETELLVFEPRTPLQYQESLRVIDSELKHLSKIVEGLFTLAMADAGQLRLANEPIYLNEILEGACALLSPIAGLKHITVNRNLSQDFPYVGDETFLRQLFAIFLENAIKFSPPSTTVQVELDQRNGILQVRFRDHGIGIAQEHLAHIFKRFYRAASYGSSESKVEASPSGGLGLAIAEAITSAMGGWIECRSEPDIGSTFTINLPLHRKGDEIISRATATP